MSELKKAVILFNLGGPSSLNSVEPFLFNLFNDKAILNIMNPLRFFLAKFISKRRTNYAKKIYEQLGGKSPILDLTYDQAQALEDALNSSTTCKHKVFVAMRYSPPFSHNIISEVARYKPDEIILLPLYPQFSTTTTASSVSDWNQLTKKKNLSVKTKTLCCFPMNEGFTSAYADLTYEKYQDSLSHGKPIILFSAHGIPLNRIKAGDPYETHIHQTTEAIVKKLNIQDLEYKVCYQSKVGPLKWLSPATESEIVQASKELKPIIVVPIAFVSEHSETLVELDIMYNELAKENGCPGYFRVSAVGTHPKFIEGLAQCCLNIEKDISPDHNSLPCSSKFAKCICINNG